MRIVAGQFKGRAIVPPPGRGTRPTTDRVREALFSALWARLGSFEGVRVLDAFAGSGALGIEALSRGAAFATFVEHDSSALKALRANIASLSLSRTMAEVRAGDTFAVCAQDAFLSRAAAAPFSLVMLDPPYALPAAEVAGLLFSLADAGALAPGALVSYEHARECADAAATAFTAPAPLDASEAGASASDDVAASSAPAPASPFTLDAQKRYGKTSISFFTYNPPSA